VATAPNVLGLCRLHACGVAVPQTLVVRVEPGCCLPALFPTPWDPTARLYVRLAPLGGASWTPARRHDRPGNTTAGRSGVAAERCDERASLIVQKLLDAELSGALARIGDSVVRERLRRTHDPVPGRRIETRAVQATGRRLDVQYLDQHRVATPDGVRPLLARDGVRHGRAFDRCYPTSSTSPAEVTSGSSNGSGRRSRGVPPGGTRHERSIAVAPPSPTP
jgi:hypothetical protein